MSSFVTFMKAAGCVAAIIASWCIVPYHNPVPAMTVMAQGARNVKTGCLVATGGGIGASYGGAKAVGDGITDDTQAILDALNIGISDHHLPAAVYLPPGNYLVHSTIILWDPGFIFGEPSHPPTIILKSGSLTNTSSPAPFLTTLSSYAHHPYDTNWFSAGTGIHGTTNNTFDMDLHDFNVVVQSGNPGCSDALRWAVAQRTSCRNINITRHDSVGTCFHETGGPAGDSGGGGGSISNITTTGGANALVVDDTSQISYRGCHFNGPVQYNGNWIINFVACTFNNRGGSGFQGNAGLYLGMNGCTFTPDTPFSCSIPYHLAQTTLSAGFVAQASSSNVYYNGTLECGTSANLNAAEPPAWPNPDLPHPTSAAVNVKSYGATGNGSTDDTAAIKAALAASGEIYFPQGAYRTTSTITLGPGQKMWGGAGAESTFIIGSSDPVLSVTGAGTGNGVQITYLGIESNNGNGTVIQWNGDPSSLVFDPVISNTAVFTKPVIVFASGGGYFDEDEPALPGSQGPTWMQATCKGPLYLLAHSVDHYSGPIITMIGASNIHLMSFIAEILNNQAAWPITNCTNIQVDGIIVGGLSPITMPDVFSVSNSTVGLYGLDGIVESGNQFFTCGIVVRNGVNYGSNGATPFLLGYLYH